MSDLRYGGGFVFFFNERLANKVKPASMSVRMERAPVQQRGMMGF